MGKVLASMSLVLAGIAATGAPWAQQSANYQIVEHAFNGGSLAVASSSFQMTLSSVGDHTAATSPSGESFSLDSGFTAAYLPPGEVSGLTFVDPQTLIWQPEASLGGYNLYRGLLSGVPAMDFGACAQNQLLDEIATDADPVPAGDGFVYLVTAENLVAEEGTKGLQSNGTARAGAVCP